MIVAALFAPGLILSSRLEGAAREALHARDASVRIRAGPLAAVQGRLARLAIRATGAMVDGSSVDEIILDLRGVTVDPGRALRGELVLQGVQSGSALLVVGEESLRRHAEGRGIRGATVRLDDGVVAIAGQITVLGTIVDVTLRAGLVMRDGRRVDLDVQQLRVVGLDLPPDVGNALAVSVNPILSAPQQPLPLRFTGVTVDRGVVRLTAEVAR